MTQSVPYAITVKLSIFFNGCSVYDMSQGIFLEKNTTALFLSSEWNHLYSLNVYSDRVLQCYFIMRVTMQQFTGFHTLSQDHGTPSWICLSQCQDCGIPSEIFGDNEHKLMPSLSIHQLYSLTRIDELLHISLFIVLYLKGLKLIDNDSCSWTSNGQMVMV